MKSVSLAIVVAWLFVGNLSAQTAPTAPDQARSARVVMAVTALPQVIDHAWQMPFGSQLGWLTASARNPSSHLAPAHVYLLRGSGTVFSPGFGELCSKLRRAGIWTEDLGSAGKSWILERIVEERKTGWPKGPLVLVGHSRGGRNIIETARELQEAGITVDLLVCLDVAGPPLVPANVRQALNLYLTEHRLYPAEPLRPAADSATRIENVDLNGPHSPCQPKGLHHLNVTADPDVQNYVVECIINVVEATQWTQRTARSRY